MAKQAEVDMFMQFKTLDLSLTGAALATEDVGTGLTVRGRLVWLVHMVEIMFPFDIVDSVMGVDVVLSTVKGQVTLPTWATKGTLAWVKGKYQWGATEASGWAILTRAFHFLPPIPIAAPGLSLYGLATAGLTSQVHARVGFTTAPLDAAAYTEIAETWGW